LVYFKKAVGRPKHSSSAVVEIFKSVMFRIFFNLSYFL